MFVQFNRKGFHWESISFTTRIALLILGLNIYLWFDFMVNVTRNRNSNNDENNGWLNELVGFSSHLIGCIIMIPIFAFKKFFSR